MDKAACSTLAVAEALGRLVAVRCCAICEHICGRAMTDPAISAVHTSELDWKVQAGAHVHCQHGFPAMFIMWSVWSRFLTVGSHSLAHRPDFIWFA